MICNDSRHPREQDREGGGASQNIESETNWNAQTYHIFGRKEVRFFPDNSEIIRLLISDVAPDAQVYRLKTGLRQGG